MVTENDRPQEQQDPPGGQPPPTTRHEHHQSVLHRLARIEGHVRAVKRMVEEDQSCPDILIQIAAVRSALNSVGRVILEDHIRNCLIDTAENGDFETTFRDLQNSMERFIR
jgi:DNA-binding FrmR family transcriptional regulator